MLGPASLEVLTCFRFGREKNIAETRYTDSQTWGYADRIKAYRALLAMIRVFDLV